MCRELTKATEMTTERTQLCFPSLLDAAGEVREEEGEGESALYRIVGSGRREMVRLCRRGEEYNVVEGRKRPCGVGEKGNC